MGGGLDGVPDVQRVQLEAFSDTNARQFNTRVDYNVTGKDLIAFSTYIVPVTTTSNDSSRFANTARPFGDFTSERRNMVGTLLWTRTLSPTMLNEARFNVTRWYFDEIASNADMPWGIPRTAVNQPAGENLLFQYGPGVGPGVFYQTTYNFRNTLTKVVNSHALKFGGDIIAEQNNDKAPWAGRPTYNFDNLWSFANDAPTSENAFFEPTTGGFTDLAAYARSKYYALFVQDDWKVRDNLTVNAGLRWEYFAPLKSANDRIANLVLGPEGALQGASMQVGGSLHPADKNNFGPQIGVAWQPGRFDNKMVVRGGWGMGYNRLPGSRTLETRFNPPVLRRLLPRPATTSSTRGRPTRTTSRTRPIQRRSSPSIRSPTCRSAAPPVNVNARVAGVRSPYSYRYSLETEYELGRGWVGSIGYQGSLGRNLARPVPYQLFVEPNPRLGNVNMLLTDAEQNYNAMLAAREPALRERATC